MSYAVAVRALCEFSARQGDLDLRFTPSPTGQEGIAGHAVVVARRGPGYQAEVSLEGRYGDLLVRGRADGYDPGQQLLEEIKTYRGKPDTQRQSHWAQLHIYGHLLCAKLGLEKVNLALVCFDIGSELETVLRETRSAGELAATFAMHCERYLAWAIQEQVHRKARDAALEAMTFPYPDFRAGQRELAEAVYTANHKGRCLLAQAPTGIGKTVGTLFPALKAAPQRGVDKVFYLAAKTSGRQLALDALGTLRAGAPGLPLRVIELVARDKACEHPDKACHGESCPLAKGFYDRLPAARSAAARIGTLDRTALRAVALEHGVCPYYLGSEMTRWSDVVVGDYNYYFDLGGMLYGLALANQWTCSVLVDEAHNLVSRARSMYSAELNRGMAGAARKAAPAIVGKAIGEAMRAWPAAPQAYEVLPAVPEKLLGALHNATAAVTDYLAEHPAPLDPALQRFYFDALLFCKLADSIGEHSLLDADDEGTLCIRNIVPAPFLKARFEAAHSATLFSATLSPWHYYSDALGLPADAAWVDVASPFAAAQLDVQLVERISTRFRHRASSVAPIAKLMARQYHARPGNYLAFFSSFDYLAQVADAFERDYPGIPAWRQARKMTEAERELFLARFTPDDCGIGFAVLGGSFGEGIDLPGARLIGAFIATLGLPQMNPVNEQLRLRMQAMFGAGYDYTYLYPGIQKVVQAAGRVIRTREDRGVVVLIDDRFARSEVRELLPAWWRL